MHRALRLLEAREQTRRQRPQRAALGLQEVSSDLLADRAVDARVRHRALPIGEERVLRGETLKLAALERIALRVFDAGLDLALVLRLRRPRRHQRGAVMRAKLPKLQIEFRIKPVGLNDRG